MVNGIDFFSPGVSVTIKVLASVSDGLLELPSESVTMLWVSSGKKI